MWTENPRIGSSILSLGTIFLPIFLDFQYLPDLDDGWSTFGLTLPRMLVCSAVKRHGNLPTDPIH